MKSMDTSTDSGAIAARFGARVRESRRLPAIGRTVACLPAVVTAACLVPGIAPGIATAADEADAAPYELGELILTADRLRVVDEVSTMDEITAEDIERAGSRTLDEALALLPGLYVRNDADGLPRIDVRGMRTRNLLLLVNGVPLNSTYDGQFDPRAVPVENIARIKITRGTSSVLYGAGGNAGVINIVTRDAPDEPTAYVTAGQTVDESWQARGRYAVRSGPLSWFVSGSAYDQKYWNLSDDFEPTDLQPNGERINSDREDEAAFSSLSYEFSDTTIAGLSVGYNSGEYGKPPITIDRRDSPFVSRVRYERVEYDRVTTQLIARHAFSDTWSVRPAVFYNTRDELTNGYDDATFATQLENGAFSEDATTTIAGASLQASYDSADLGLVTLSAAGRRESWDASGFVLETAGGGGGGGGGGSAVSRTQLDEGHDTALYTLAAEWETHFSDDLSGVAGASWNQQRRDDADDVAEWSYLVGARYAFTRDLRIRGSWGRQIRFPTLRDLYAIDRGNPGLEPETTDNVEIGLEREFLAGRSALEFVLYRVDAEGFIARGDSGLAENLDELRFQGFEINARYAAARNLELRLNYTFLDSENRGNDADTDALQQRPEQKFSLRLDYDFATGMRLYGSYLYVADSLALSRDEPAVTTEVGDYHVMDLGVSQLLWQQRLRLIGRVENVFDEDYQESFGFPQHGRRYFLGAELRL